MFVPLDRESEVKAIARRTAERFRVGDPRSTDRQLGPVVSEVQFERIQGLIQSGIDEGAEFLIGGVGRPEGLNRGYYVRPTIFAGVRPEMRISREEIFGPVLSILTYRNLDEAVEPANDTPYGLQAYVQSADLTQARRVAARLRAGRVSINYPVAAQDAPFGGYKQSGNGREGASSDWRSILRSRQCSVTRLPDRHGHEVAWTRGSPGHRGLPPLVLPCW